MESQNRVERMMEHMRALCKEIGPRPSASRQERRAAQYVKDVLARIGCRDVREQSFRSQNSMSWIIVIVLLAQLLALPLAWVGGLAGRLAGIVLLLGGFWVLREYFLAKMPFFQPLVARGTSQNIIAHIPPAGSEKRTIHLIGHLDTQKQRFQSPPPNVNLFPANSTILLLTPVLGAVFLLLDILSNRQGIPWWEWVIGGLLLLFLALFLADEVQPEIEGANDNATAVSVLLMVAETLRSAPLQNSGVTLLFTGCEEVLCVGMENYLQQFQPRQEDTCWIDLEMVGAGNLCYVTRHGVTYLTRYSPAPAMVALAEQTAQRLPELGVTGREMIILDEVANLRNRGHQAICLAGYNQAGHLPNWHRVSDDLEHIQPAALERTCRFTLAFLEEIDRLPD